MNSPSPKPGDAPFEAWLNRHASIEPLPDAGFSARVLVALPPARSPFAWRQTIVCAMGAMAGILATRLDLGAWPTLGNVFEPISGAIRATLTFFSDPWIAVALATTVMLAAASAAIYFTLHDEDSPESPF